MAKEAEWSCLPRATRRDTWPNGFFWVGIDYLDGLRVTLQAQNLTDEDDIQASSTDPRQITQFQSYGTNYLLGFNYKF